MPRVGDLGISQPANDVGQLMCVLVFFRETEATPHVYSVRVALVTVHRPARWCREPYIGDRSLDVGHIPAAEMAGLITKLLSIGAGGRHEEAGAFKPAASQYEGLCRYDDLTTSMRAAFQTLGSTSLTRADDFGTGNARQEPDTRRSFQVVLVGSAKIRRQ